MDIQGGLKRVGGQGDILSGAVGTFLAWGKVYEDADADWDDRRSVLWVQESQLRGSDRLFHHRVDAHDIPILASLGGSQLTRTCSRLAFGKHRRSVVTSHMIEEVGVAYESLFGEDESDGCE